jgi:NAD(P)H dehydrogenase (quinone)
MTIVVTGATGHLGHLIVESLLSRGVPADQVVAAGRNLDKVADLVERGVSVAAIDYEDAASLDSAFAGADTLVLVSSSEVGKRATQHAAAIDAASRAGVGRVIYTSAPAARTSTLILAPEHKATEEYLEKSGLGHTVLRNGWYHENYVGSAAQAAASGTLASSAGDGTVASASRADYAEAAAIVATTDGHEGAVYELSGDIAWSFAELAATISSIAGTPVSCAVLTPEEHHEALTGAGLDEGTAGFVVALDGNIRDGLLGGTSGDLSRLLGRPTTPIEATLAGALKG